MIRLLFRNIVISWNNGHSINRFLFMSKFSYNASKMCTHVIWIFRMLPNYNPKFIIIYFEGDLAQKVNRLWRGLKTFKSRVLYAVRALGIVWDGKPLGPIICKNRTFEGKRALSGEVKSSAAFTTLDEKYNCYESHYIYGVARFFGVLDGGVPKRQTVSLNVRFFFPNLTMRYVWCHFLSTG